MSITFIQSKEKIVTKVITPVETTHFKTEESVLVDEYICLKKEYDSLEVKKLTTRMEDLKKKLQLIAIITRPAIAPLEQRHIPGE